MKLAMLAPIAWRTPPRHYGPWESIASLLTEGLVARGVDVTLFATLDSVTAAALDGVCPHGYAEDAQLDGRVWEALHVSHALARSGEFELVHNHLDWLPLAFGEHARAPMVTTIHGFSGAGILPAYTRSRSAFVAISDSDRYAGLDYAATIRHGIDLRMLPYHATGGGSLVSFGRIHPDKGTADAVEIARRAGRRLVICGIVQDAFTDDVLMENGPGAGSWHRARGKDDLALLLLKFASSLGETFHQDGRCVYADDRVAISLIHQTGTAPGGDRFDNLAVYISRLRPDGQTERLWTVDLDAEHREAFWAKTPVRLRRTFPDSGNGAFPAPSGRSYASSTATTAALTRTQSQATARLPAPGNPHPVASTQRLPAREAAPELAVLYRSAAANSTKAHVSAGECSRQVLQRLAS